MRIILVIFLISLTSCYNDQKTREVLTGKDLNLDYEVLGKKNLFPNDNIEFHTGYIIINIPDSSFFVDIAESVRNIGLKENLVSAKIFKSKTGYMMETDSIPPDYSRYLESYIGYYDLTTKGVHWRIFFKLEDIRFKGDLPIKIKL